MILHREDTYVVDLRIDAARRAAGDRDLEFARQIREVAIADKEIVHAPNQRRHVVKLIRVDSRNRTTDYVANRVATGIGGGQANAIEYLENLRYVVDPDPMKLDVLPDGYVSETFAELARQLSDRQQLACVQLAARDSDANHKVTVFVRALSVDAIPFEERFVFGSDPVFTLRGVSMNIREHVQPVFALLDVFNLVHSVLLTTTQRRIRPVVNHRAAYQCSEHARESSRCFRQPFRRRYQQLCQVRAVLHRDH